MSEEHHLSPRVHPDDLDRVAGLKAIGAMLNTQRPKGKLSYYTPILIQCTLPHSDPKTNYWVKTNGEFSLVMFSGADSTGRPYGVPYGSFPRLVLSHVITQVIKTKDKHVDLGESLGWFLREIGYTGNLRGGMTRAARSIRDQMLRLVKASLQFERRGGTEEAGRLAGVNIHIASKYELWWDFKKPDEESLWGSSIEISDNFRQAILSAPVPLRTDVLKDLHKSPLALDVVAPQLTVVSAPPLNQAFERMRGTPALLGWCPTRRRHMKRQQFLDGPAMIRDASGHRRCGPATGMGQTRMRCTEIIDRPDQIHAMLQRQRAARQRPASACQRGQPLTERRVQPLDVGRIDHPVALRAAPERLDACRRAIHNAAFDLDHAPLLVALDDLGDADIAPRTQPGPSAVPCAARDRERSPEWRGCRTPSHRYRPTGGAGPHSARTRSISRRISGMSRCSLTSPASHKRVLTIMASAIQTMPPCFLTRISSACTCPRSRGCSTRCSCTAWPWRPARAPHAATVRSSKPKATTIACSGQPWASNVTTRVTVSAEVRRR